MSMGDPSSPGDDLGSPSAKGASSKLKRSSSGAVMLAPGAPGGRTESVRASICAAPLCR